MLSVGGVLGAFQAGFLRTLFRNSFRPSLIVGTSAGALNGSFLALRPDEQGAEELVGIWRELRHQRLFLFNPLRIAYQVASRQLCLSNGAILSELAERHLPVDDFAATQVPLYITATNLSQGRKVTFHEGGLSRAILASKAPSRSTDGKRMRRPGVDGRNRAVSEGGAQMLGSTVIRK